MVWNRVAGLVESIHQGLTRTGIHLRIGQHASIRLRLPSDIDSPCDIRIGQQVVAQVAADAVLLGVPGRWPGKDRWNRWAGRIVLVEPGTASPRITVKVQGEQWTLKSLGPVLGSDRPPRTWDQVNIVVDPSRVELRRAWPGDAVPRAPSMTVRAQGLMGGRVWLKGTVQAIRQVPTGWLLSFDIGGARVSSLVCAESGLPWHLMPGVPVEVHVGQWEAWIKPVGMDTSPVQCRLLYQDLEPCGSGSQAPWSPDLRGRDAIPHGKRKASTSQPPAPTD